MAVMRGALEEAVCSGSPAVAQSLAAAVQDVAELAGALLPSVRARELQVLPPVPPLPAACSATCNPRLLPPRQPCISTVHAPR